MRSVLKSILVILVIVASWVGAYELVFKNQLAEKARLVKQMREQACVVDELKKLSREATPARYESILSPALETLVEKVPATPDVSELITELTALSKKAKISLVSYETTQNQESILAEIRVAGGVKQVFEFLAGLSNLERLVLVERFNYENRSAEIWLKAPWGQFNLGEVLARHIPYHCGAAEQLNFSSIEIPWLSVLSQKISPVTRNPFLERSQHITARGLHLVGLVQQRSAWLALVEDEHGFGQVIRVGDKLSNGFQVLGISRQGLSLASGNIRQTMTWRKP